MKSTRKRNVPNEMTEKDLLHLSQATIEEKVLQRKYGSFSII